MDGFFIKTHAVQSSVRMVEPRVAVWVSVLPYPLLQLMSFTVKLRKSIHFLVEHTQTYKCLCFLI